MTATVESALAASPSAFVAEEALNLRDVWSTSVYSGLCFDRNRWLLPVQRRPGVSAAAFRSPAFSRYPLQVKVVADRAKALAPRKAACWREGVTFVADLRHGGGATMGIAHFAKRILRLHGLQQQAAAYGLARVDRIAFPATSAAHLAHSWPSSMLQLIAPAAATLSVEQLTAAPCCYETVVASARENTYFVRERDADVLRSAAYARAGLSAVRPACAPLRVCYFQRSEGKPSGRWEGGARLIANRAEVLQLMESIAASEGQGARVRVVNINSTHTFDQQVALFAGCDLMVSVHGSQNANLMFMRPGAAFMEINPYKFYYSSYAELAAVSRVLYLPSRRNVIAVSGRSVTRFHRDYARFSDDDCQQHSRCRGLSRNFPTRVNATDFRLEFRRGMRHLAASFPRAASCPPL